ncbi:MAG TPA: SurA N-terminal domain-containing protein, partial [Burkholderiaceae bacterium]
MTDSSFRVLTLAAVLSASLAAQAQSGNSPTSTLRPGDQIAAVVNQDVVAASEVVARTEKLREEAKRRGEAMPDPELLKKQALEALIEDRVLITHARDSGARVDEPELDRTVNNVAAQNKISLDELKVRLKAEGMDYKRFRETLRDQMLTERVREREVQGRIKITDGDVDKYLEDQAAKAAANPPVNIAQVLIGIPDGAAEAVVAEKRALADKALARVLAGEDFSKVAKDMSEDSNH